MEGFKSKVDIFMEKVDYKDKLCSWKDEWV